MKSRSAARRVQSSQSRIPLHPSQMMPWVNCGYPGLGVLTQGSPSCPCGSGPTWMQLLQQQDEGLNFASQAHLKMLLSRGVSAGAQEHVSPRGDLCWDSWSLPFCTRGNSSLLKTAHPGGTRSWQPEAPLPTARSVGPRKACGDVPILLSPISPTASGCPSNDSPGGCLDCGQVRLPVD